MFTEQRNPTQVEMSKIMSFDSDLKSIKLRAEGEVNQMWTFRLNNPRTNKQYSIGVYAYEGAPQFDYTDQRVYEVSEEFDNFLEMLFTLVWNHYPKNFDELADA